jgi:hypothetical protein
MISGLGSTIDADQRLTTAAGLTEAMLIILPPECDFSII